MSVCLIHISHIVLHFQNVKVINVYGLLSSPNTIILFYPLVNEPVNSYFISTLQGAYDPTTIIRRLELIVHIAISVLPGTH